jgi:hypothetical protein
MNMHERLYEEFPFQRRFARHTTTTHMAGQWPVLALA